MIENTIEKGTNNLRRRELLPWWIKVFSWFFLLFGILAFICLLLGFTSLKPDLALYGFETNEPFSLFGLIIISIGIFKGFTAYAIWFEKDNAIKLGKIDAIMGIIITSITMVVFPFLLDGYDITIRLELLILIPFLIKLNKIEDSWTKILT